MSQQGKGSLLLPIGIGAGLLLLLTSMKKKEAVTPAATPGPDDTAAMLPEIAAGASPAAQIDPVPAPSYTQAVAKTATSESDAEAGEDGEETEKDPQEEAASSGGDGEEGGVQDEEGSEDDAPSYAGKSSGGSYTPYSPASSISTNRQTTPLPAPAYSQAATNQPSITNRKSIRFQSDQASQQALQKARNNKSIRFQSDQSKMVTVRSGTVNNNPLFIGKGKPRMGVRPVATTTAAMPVVSVTSQPAAKTAQATIFPLKFGTSSPYVKEVQRKLGVSATGYFGTMTRTALQKRFRVSEVSEALYKQIITGKAPARIMPVRKPVVRPAAKAAHRIKKPMVKKLKPVRRK